MAHDLCSTHRGESVCATVSHVAVHLLLIFGGQSWAKELYFSWKNEQQISSNSTDHCRNRFISPSSEENQCDMYDTQTVAENEL